MKNLAFLCRDERWLYYQFLLPRLEFVSFELGSERVNVSYIGLRRNVTCSLEWSISYEFQIWTHWPEDQAFLCWYYRIFGRILAIGTKMKWILLYRNWCLAGKYTVHKTHTKLHPGPERHIFNILTGGVIDDVISRFSTLENAKWVLFVKL